jgi:hypothetical protein
MRRTGAGPLAIALLVAFAVAGCDAFANMVKGPAPTPQPCGQLFNAVRCLAMTDAVASRLVTTRENVASLEVLPDPTPEVRDGVTIIQVRGGAAPIELLATMADGTEHQVSMCGGIPSGPACSDDPHIDTYSISKPGAGYHDVPEGASPVPSAAPDALEMATELHIDRLDIPIEHTGPHEIVLGEAWLPNGLLTEADFELVDDWPPGLTILDGGVSLEVRSQLDGRPIWNIYEHGWREGIEGVDAVLVFDVFRFDPGAKLSIADVIVR